MFVQITMPRKPGWVCITIQKQTHEKVKEKAAEEGKDIQDLADQLIAHALEVPADG